MQPSQAFNAAEILKKGNVLALSWKIATEPSLYHELAPNPYSIKAAKIISERFPGVSPGEIIRAIILAGPEGRYDRFFKQLSRQLQERESYRHSCETAEITGRLNECYREQARELRQSPAELRYEILFKAAFESNDLEEVEQKFSRKQRIDLRLLISQYITKLEEESLIDQIEKLRLLDFETDSKVPSGSQKLPKVSLPKKTLSKVVFAESFLIVIISLSYVFWGQKIIQEKNQNLAYSQNAGEQILAVSAQKIGRPMHLSIPSINVDAPVKELGLTKGGAMEVPGNTFDVGWYKLGPSPGERGSAVISGHFDGRREKLGVFDNLDKLKPGDRINVTDDQGATITFAVRESRNYNPGYADEVFLSNDEGRHLNLVTCDGPWDEQKKVYTKRLVVFADTI